MIAVVVLAGGEGRRMGGGKPLRRLGGRTLIEQVVERSLAWSPLVAVSVRERGQAGPLAVPEILDSEREGPLAGLAAALRFAREKGAECVLTVACDMPFLPNDLPKRLNEALTPAIGAAIAASGGALHPVCGLWRSDTLDALPTYRGSSLKGFAERIGHVAVEWPAQPRDPFLNVNRPDELAEAERLLRSR